MADDTGAWQRAVSLGTQVQGQDGATYRTTASLGAPRNGATIDLNGSTIIANWEQPANPSAFLGVFELSGQHNVTIRGGKIQYAGTFDLGPSYDGVVSGIYALNSNYLTVEDMEITGFNRAGIFVGALFDASPPTYCKSPRVLNCHLHHNRIVGVGFGATEEGLVTGCQLHWNGHVDDIGTGYGFAGWSTGNPKNTVIAGNICNDNYRKGLDFHSGHNGAITGNICARNRNDGIYVMHVTGGWTINGNVIDDMLWEGTFTNSSMYGIRAGELVGFATDVPPTSFTIIGNTISNFRLTDGSAFPIFLGGQGQTTRFNIAKNVLRLGKVEKILECTPTATHSGDYFDVAFDGNQVFCEESMNIPFTIRGKGNRKKSFSNNQIEILATDSSLGIYLYEVTSETGKSLVAMGNDITAPASAWSAAYDPIRVRRVADEIMEGNIVNGAPWREWDGAKYIGRGPGASPPSDSRLWTTGSIWQRTDVAAGVSPGSVCIASGMPGKWQALSSIFP